MVTEVRRPSREGAARVVAGVVFLLLAIVVFAASRVSATGQRHAYDPAAIPAPTYALTAGKTYQLSSGQGVKQLTESGVVRSGAALSCFLDAGGGAQEPVKILSTKDDDRVLHLFATFQAARSGHFTVGCAGIDGVFIDDADDSPSDTAAALMILATALGLIGAIAALSGGHALTAPRSSDGFRDI